MSSLSLENGEGMLCSKNSVNAIYSTCPSLIDIFNPNLYKFKIFVVLSYKQNKIYLCLPMILVILVSNNVNELPMGVKNKLTFLQKYFPFFV